MTFTGLNGEIDEARAVYKRLRGYLREEPELTALDGAFNALKAPERLVVAGGASLDQRCESLSDMVTGLHRVADLLSALRRHIQKRVLLSSLSVDSAIDRLRDSPGFQYCEHFANAVKHTVYVRRGEQNGLLYMDAFSYSNRGRRVEEPRRTSEEILAFAREVVTLSTPVLASMTEWVEGSSPFDAAYSEVCATPSPEPYPPGDGSLDDDS